MKIVLFQNSNTQRVSVQQTSDENILITKDWKKSSKDTEWIAGKGITIPIKHIISLGKIFGKDSSERNTELEKFTIIKEESEC